MHQLHYSLDKKPLGIVCHALLLSLLQKTKIALSIVLVFCYNPLINIGEIIVDKKLYQKPEITEIDVSELTKGGGDGAPESMGGNSLLGS